MQGVLTRAQNLRKDLEGKTMELKKKEQIIENMMEQARDYLKRVNRYYESNDKNKFDLALIVESQLEGFINSIYCVFTNSGDLYKRLDKIRKATQYSYYFHCEKIDVDDIPKQSWEEIEPGRK